MPAHWILGNWKQNHLREAAAACARDLAAGLTADPPAGVTIAVCPPYLSIAAVQPHARPASALWMFAQDCAAQDRGAFTGEVGPAMLVEAGVHGALVGHSERRACFGEDDTAVAAKLGAVLQSGLHAVLCVGESLRAREDGTHESVVISQLSAAFSNVSHEHIGPRIILAYEPVWAIGTGHTATPAQASAMHAAMRGWMTERFGAAGADRSILYGGSVKSGNAAELSAAPDVDGFLVGGASLDPAAFLAIVRAAAWTAQ